MPPRKWHERRGRRKPRDYLSMKRALEERGAWALRRLGRHGRWALFAVLCLACFLLLRTSASHTHRAQPARGGGGFRRHADAGDDDYDTDTDDDYTPRPRPRQRGTTRRSSAAAHRSQGGAARRDSPRNSPRKKKRGGKKAAVAGGPTPPRRSAPHLVPVVEAATESPHRHGQSAAGDAAALAVPAAAVWTDRNTKTAVLRLPNGDVPRRAMLARTANTNELPQPMLSSPPLLPSPGAHAGATTLARSLPAAVVPAGLLLSLRTVEQRTNTLWNRSKVDVLVTGDPYYVKRDFPLYRQAFSAHGFDLRESAKKASGRERNKGAFLCYAIHTSPDCFASTGTFGARNALTKINRLPMIRRILWTKDRFCRTVNDATKGMAEALGPASLDFFFRCWVTPVMLPALLEHAQSADRSSAYIVKPTDNGEGTGIYIEESVHGLKRLGRLPALDNGHRPRRLVQTYLSDPHLINGFKWDLRTYVLVTSAYPLRAYVFHEGLVRFASTKYTKASKKKTAFLTNTSINKHKTGSASSGTWSFKQLEDHFTGEGHDYAQLFGRIKRAITLLLLTAEKQFYKRFVRYRHGCANCYQLLGVARQIFAEHHFRLNALHCTATGRILIVAECFCGSF